MLDETRGSQGSAIRKCCCTKVLRPVETLTANIHSRHTWCNFIFVTRFAQTGTQLTLQIFVRSVLPVLVFSVYGSDSDSLAATSTSVRRISHISPRLYQCTLQSYRCRTSLLVLFRGVLCQSNRRWANHAIFRNVQASNRLVWCGIPRKELGFSEVVPRHWSSA